MEQADLVPLKPSVFTGVACPACADGAVEAVRTIFPGIHVLAEYHCRSCQAGFLRDLPVGFAVEYPVSIDLGKSRMVPDPHVPGWIHEPLMEGYREPNGEQVRIERKVFRHCEDIILLNTLDYLYGHVLLKLFNATHYLDHHPSKGLVVMVPAALEWLVPDGVAEVWTVQMPLGRMQHWYTGIDAFVQERIAEHRSVSLGKAFGHPDMVGVDIGRYTRVAPFPHGDFDLRRPEFTFVVREDRLWLPSPVWKLLRGAFGRLGMRNGPARWPLRIQDHLVRATMVRIRKALPEARFNVVGLGRPGGMPAGVEDLRTKRMDLATEQAWCKAYARSHAVIGVHGSNMLLPTAHAAGCVEILPHDRYGNIVQDITVRHADRMQLFLVRFVDEHATPAMVARHAVSMVRDHRLFQRNNQVHVFATAERPIGA